MRRRRSKVEDDGTILCRGCREYKDQSAFDKNASSRSGYHPYCRECRSRDKGQIGKYAQQLYEAEYGPIPDNMMLVLKEGVDPQGWVVEDLVLIPRPWKYLRITVDGKRVPKHRYVWEQANGPIPDGHDVHHKDGNIFNNELSNLELVIKAEHVRHHATTDQHEKRKEAGKLGGEISAEKRRKVGPPGTSWCRDCNDFLPETSFTKSKSSWNGLDPVCRTCKAKRRRGTNQ